MKCSKKIAPLLIFLCSLFQTASACTCTDYGVPVCKLYRDADAVFVGTVERVASVADDNASVAIPGVGSISSFGSNLNWIHFRVEQGYKGVAGNRVKALTYHGTSCDLDPREGQRWVIFAHKDPKTGNLSFGACGGNDMVEKNAPILKELKTLNERKSPLVVSGRVGIDAFSEIKGAVVTVSRGGFQRTITTDESGSYKFEAPAEGAYTVRVAVPFSALLWGFASDVQRVKQTEPTENETTFEYEATASRGSCDYEFVTMHEIDLKATASISGRFIQHDWPFFSKFFPQLCRLQLTEAETLKTCRSAYSLDRAGNFVIDGLREGRYTIVINEDDYPDSMNPFLRHYYPGVREFAKAKAIELEQGQEISGIQFNLPPRLPVRELKGQIVREDGEPATFTPGSGDKHFLSIYSYESDPKYLNTNSFLVDWGEGREEKTIEMKNAFPDGSFSVLLFEGYDYIIRAETNPWGDKRACGVIKVGKEADPKDPLKIEIKQGADCDAKKFVQKLESSQQ